MTKATVIILLAILGSISLPLIPPAGQAVENTVVFAPVIIDTNLAPGDTLTLAINVTNVELPEDMDGWQAIVKLNASVLRILNVRDGPVLDDVAETTGGQTFSTTLFDAAAGTATGSELLVLPGAPPQPADSGFTGSGDLMYIDVQVIVNGTSTISFDTTLTKLRDIDGDDFVSINHRVRNGVFSNVPVVLPPVASFTTSPSRIFAGTNITYDASESYDIDGTIVKYSWNFGDGPPDAVVNSTDVTYVTGELVITGRAPANGTVLKDDPNIKYVDPNSNDAWDIGEAIVYSTDFTYVTGELVIVGGPPINGTVLKDDAGMKYDDSDSNDVWDATLIEIDPVTFHVYIDPNTTFQITLTVTDDDGATNSTRRTLLVGGDNLPPVAVFTFSPENPKANQPVTFNATGSYDPEGRLDLQPFLWDFGDASRGGGKIVPHTYTVPGTYNVTLTVVDRNRQRTTVEKQVTVEPGEAILQVPGTPFWIIPAAAVGGLIAVAAVFFLWKRRTREREEDTEGLGG